MWHRLFVGVLWVLCACHPVTDDETAGRSQSALEASDCPAGANVILGTDGDDVLVGTPGADCIVGYGGDDTLDGRGGNDALFGGDGDDTLTGGAGDDVLHGEDGADDLDGGNGNDELHGGPGNDTLGGGNGADVLDGGDGDDTLAGDNGGDTATGGAGNDVLIGGSGADTLSGGDGNDAIVGDSGGDTLDGGEGSDAIVGGGNDAVDGGGGDDFCTGTGCEGAAPPASGGCSSDADCASGTRCLVAAGICVACQTDLECDDGAVCTVDRCNPIAGCFYESNEGATCDDGNACTQSDVCRASACSGESPVVCTALDQCHDPGVCDPASGVCSDPPKIDGSACDDGNACTQVDACVAGACAGSDPVVCTALDQCHDAGECDPATGVCTDPPVADGTACDDGSVCNGFDSCQAGTCAPTPPSPECAATRLDESPTFQSLALSDDGRFVAYLYRSALGYPRQGVRILDRVTGARTDLPASFDWHHTVSISADGARVVFSDYAGIWIYETASGSLSEVAPDGRSAGPALGASLSADGRFVVFDSYRSDLVPGDTNGRHDVFVYEIATGAIDRVSVGITGAAADDRSFASAISGDGRYVAFVSYATNMGDDALDPAYGVFLRDRQSGSTLLVTSDGRGVGWQSPSISRDGRVVAFQRCDGTCRIDIHDMAAGTLVSIPGARDVEGSQVPLSANGRFVFYSTPDPAHVPGDGDDRFDAFVLDRWTGTTRHVPGDSDGAHDFEGAISPDGRLAVLRSFDPALSREVVIATCVGVGPLSCDDGNTCTTDSCDPTAGCSNDVLPDGSSCSDGNACTQVDTCSAAACVGADPVVCTALDQCHSAGTCDTETGSCSNPARPNGTTCDDGAAWPFDVCTGGVCTEYDPRDVTVSGTAFLRDHDSWGSDETRRVSYSSHVHLRTVLPSYTLSFGGSSWCVDDELMGRLYVTVSLLSDYQSVRVVADGRLYESDHCPNGDQDGERTVTVGILAPGAGLSYSFRVNNEREGGDYIDFAFSVSNEAVPF